MKINERDVWVAEKLEAVRPEWRPDVGRARALLARGDFARGRGHGWAWVAATAACLVAMAIAMPEGRLMAQSLWYRFVVRSFAVVRLDLSRVPLESSISSNGAARSVNGMEEAAQLAGFQPLSLAECGPGQSVVTGPMHVTQVVRVAALREALRKVGALDVDVPDAWEGLELHMDLGPMVITEYRGDAQVIQSRPIALHVPSGLPFERFAEAAFRSAGVAAWQASLMASKFARNPAWLLDVPEGEAVVVEEVAIGASQGLLVEDPKEDKGSRVAVMFGTYGTKARIFAVSSDSRELSLRLARSIAAGAPIE
jgi:hypothetical protein